MTTLHLHTINFDNAHAPNPYFGVCTLATCALHVRRSAKPGDLIVGLGARGYHIIDDRNPSATRKQDIGFRGRVVYAMLVSQTLTWPQYIRHCTETLVGKIPDMDGRYEQRCGDCQYELVTRDSGGYELKQIDGLHVPSQADSDLRAGVLLGHEFFYAGSRAAPAPEWLAALQAKGQEPVRHTGATAQRALDWFAGEPRGILGKPMLHKLVHY